MSLLPIDSSFSGVKLYGVELYFLISKIWLILMRCIKVANLKRFVCNQIRLPVITTYILSCVLKCNFSFDVECRLPSIVYILHLSKIFVFLQKSVQFMYKFTTYINIDAICSTKIVIDFVVLFYCFHPCSCFIT